MKNVLFLALLAGSVTVAAGQGHVRKVNDASIGVWTDNLSVVRVYDLKNGLIHKESIEGDKSKTFNMKTLSDGEYLMEVEDNQYFTSVPFDVVSAGKIEMAKPVQVGLPKITQKGSSIHVIRAGEKSYDKVSIFNSSDELIFEEVMSSLHRGQNLDLSNVRSGTYLISIATNGKVFDHTISISGE